MEIKSFQDVVDQIGLFPMLVDTIERVAGGLHRQCRDLESLAIGRDGRNTGRDAKPNVVVATQLFHHAIDLLSIRSLWVEDGFRIVENYDHLLGGQEGK